MLVLLFSRIINYTKKSLRPHGLGDFSVRGVFLQPPTLSTVWGGVFGHRLFADFSKNIVFPEFIRREKIFSKAEMYKKKTC